MIVLKMQQNNHRPPDVNRRPPEHDAARRTSLIERINTRISKTVTYRTNSQFSYGEFISLKYFLGDMYFTDLNLINAMF